MTKNIMIKMSSQGNEVLKGQACRKRHTSSTGLQLKSSLRRTMILDCRQNCKH